MDESGLKYSTAEQKAQAVREIEELVKSGLKVKQALQKVAYNTGLSERSLYTYLKKTKGVAVDDRETALERKKAPPRKRLVCHPEALKRFIALCRAGGKVSECYRQMEIEAKAHNWTPILPERTLRRELDRQVPWAERFVARRADKHKGGL